MKFFKKRNANASTLSESSTFDGYETRMPSLQNAIDLVPGWVNSLPSEFKVKAGGLGLYADRRIKWMLDEYGSLENKQILELGPLEASHTGMMHGAGAQLIDAVEANKMAFLRCLVVKEAMRLNNAYFHLGDFGEWLENTDKVYDLIVASGVLYHMKNPIRLLELLTKRSNALFIWTHYVDDEQMPIGDPRRGALQKEPVVEQLNNAPIRLYPRSYYAAQQSEFFCGGPEDQHYWIEKNDLLSALKLLGFNSIKINYEEPEHPNGPCFCVLAER